MKAVRTFLSRIRKSGARRPGLVTTVAMGRTRSFEAWDLGDDTYIFEQGVSHHLDEHPSILLVEKGDLRRRAKGRVMTMTTGNHSVAAFPLLDGRFWKLSRLSSMKRGDVLMHAVLCANVVQDKIEISQRDVPAKRLFKADEWLLGSAGFALQDIVMGERTDATLDHYRRLGQEWRVKQLAWSENEMRVALAASKKRISSKVTYYHSMKGVHFLSFSEFERFVALAKTEPQEFVKALREMVSVYEGNQYSFMRMPKHRGHHEVELFGLQRGVAMERIVPELEKLMEAIALGRIDEAEMARRAEAVKSLYSSLLARTELADEKSTAFVENIYMHITGEIYSVAGEGSTPAFDDRRTALPGATFVDGRPVFHPGSDDRSEVLLSNIRGLMSKDERVEYANVYELRAPGDDAPLGRGKTREIVFKTNRSPVEVSKIEKRLSMARNGYASYMLARIEAFKALGVALSRPRARAAHGRRRRAEHGDEEVRPEDEHPALRRRQGDIRLRVRHHRRTRGAEVGGDMLRPRQLRLARPLVHRREPVQDRDVLPRLLRACAQDIPEAPQGDDGGGRGQVHGGFRVQDARDGVEALGAPRPVRGVPSRASAHIRVRAKVEIRALVPGASGEASVDPPQDVLQESRNRGEE